MSNISGFVLPAATIGFGPLLIRPQPRGFFPFDPNGAPLQTLVPQATFEETHTDELEITDHPVESGAVISDHAFKRPAEVIIRCGWSNSPSRPGGFFGAAITGGRALEELVSDTLGITAVQSVLSGNSVEQVKAIYARLLAIQESRVPFDILTGKRAYKSMLLKQLRIDTAKDSENALIVTAHCRQIIIVTTGTVTVPGSATSQKFPAQTGATQDLGSQSLQPAPKFTDPEISE